MARITSVSGSSSNRGTQHITAKGLKSSQVGLELSYEDIPDTCPLCHTAIVPHIMAAVFRSKTNESAAEVIFQCTKCERLFIGTYTYPIQDSSGQADYRFSGLAPKTAQETKFSEEISTTSPIFVEVYNQALAAEAENLTHLSGMGLRKALEFLIKDFLISKNPDDKGDIEKIFLGTCIERYINDNNLKECAKRAVWLGNDETHYIRKWEDKDVNDLKLLIRLTVSWIETILLTDKYIHEMPPP